MGNTEQGEMKKKCIACFEEIQAKATVCPHCRSSQKHIRWKLVGDVFKWVGSFTVIISFVIGALQVNNFYKSWIEKERFVEQLVTAADIQMKQGDFEGAWKMLDEALIQKPASYLAREMQIRLAMMRLSKVIYIRGSETKLLVSQMLPVLHRGISVSDKLKADVYAHIGHGNGLRFREGNKSLKVDFYFDEALRIDEENVFANSMKGYWIHKAWLDDEKNEWNQLTANELVKKSSKYFSAALKTNKHRNYVRQLQLAAYYPRNRAPLAGAYLQTIIQMKKNNEVIPDLGNDHIYGMYLNAFEADSNGDSALIDAILLSVPSADIQMITTWLEGHEDIKDIQKLYLKLLQARLSEEGKDFKNALMLYESIYSEAKDSVYTIKHYIPKFIQRVCDNAGLEENDICNKVDS